MMRFSSLPFSLFFFLFFFFFLFLSVNCLEVDLDSHGLSFSSVESKSSAIISLDYKDYIARYNSDLPDCAINATSAELDASILLGEMSTGKFRNFGCALQEILRLEHATGNKEHLVVVQSGPVSGSFSIFFDVHTTGVSGVSFQLHENGMGYLVFAAAANESSVITYSKLVVFDSTGARVPAIMACGDAGSRNLEEFSTNRCNLVHPESFVMAITVQSSASYPVVIDPIVSTGFPLSEITDSDAVFTMEQSFATVSGVACVFPFSFGGNSYSTCISTPERKNWCSSIPVFETDPTKFEFCEEQLLGFSVAIGNLGSTTAGRNDIVIGSPGAQNRKGRVTYHRNNNGVFSSTPTTLLAGTVACNSVQGTMYGTNICAKRNAAGAGFSRLLFGSAYCNSVSVYNGATTTPSLVTTYDYAAHTYAIGRNFDLTGIYLANSAAGGIRINHVASPNVASSVPRFGAYVPGAAPFNVYADGFMTDLMLVADPKGFGNSGVVYASNTGSCTSSACTPLWSAMSDQLDCGWGHSMTFADVNGDGRPDAFIGAPFYSSSGGRLRNAGIVRMYYGHATTTFEELPAWTGFGEASGDQYGYSLANLFDINADNAHDIAVGAPFAENGRGKIFIYLGYWDTTVTRVEGLQLHQTVLGSQPKSLFGFSLAAGRDVTADGVPDIVIGAPGFSNSRTANAGKVIVGRFAPYTDVAVRIRNSLFTDVIDTWSSEPLIVQFSFSNAGLIPTGPMINTITIPDVGLFGTPEILPEYGITVSYWTNNALTGTPVLTRNENTVSFNIGTGSPDALVPVDNFSARYEGYIVPTVTRNYVFRLESNDGSRMYLDSTLIANTWSGTGTVSSSPQTLVAGQQYRFTVEYREFDGAANLRFSWSATGFSDRIIESEFFRPLVPAYTITCGQLSCTVESVSLSRLRSCWACASNPAGTVVVPALRYVLNPSFRYPSTITFTATNGLTDVVLQPITAVHTIELRTLANLQLARPRAFVPDPSSYAANPACSDTAIGICELGSGESLISLRGISFANTGPGTAFAVGLSIFFPPSVLFYRTQTISTQTINDQTVSGFSCSRVQFGVSCLFSSLDAGETITLSDYELIFGIPNLREAGAWRFQMSLTTLSVLQSTASAASASNYVRAPATTADLSIPADGVSVTSGSCCSDALTVCAGATADISVEIRNIGNFGSSDPVVVFTPPSSNAQVTRTPRMLQNGRLRDCLVGTGSTYICYFPDNNLGNGRFALLLVAMYIAPDAPEDPITFSLSVSGDAEESDESNNELESSAVSVCRVSSFSVGMIASPTSIFPSSDFTIIASVLNQGPSQFSGTEFVHITLPEELADLVHVSGSGSCSLSADPFLISCSVPQLAFRGTAQFPITLNLDGRTLPTGTFTLTLPFSAEIDSRTASTSVVVNDNTNLQVLMNSARRNLYLGQQQLLTILVQNNHPANVATDVVLVTSLPLALEYKSVTVVSGYPGLVCNVTTTGISNPDVSAYITCEFPLVKPYYVGCTVTDPECQIIVSISTETVSPGVLLPRSQFTSTSTLTGAKPDLGPLKVSSVSFDLFQYPDLRVAFERPRLERATTGETFDHTVRFFNDGRIPAENVTFTLEMSKGEDEVGAFNIQYVRATFDCENPIWTHYTFSCFVPILQPSESYTLQLTYFLIDEAGISFTTRISVTSDTLENNVVNNVESLQTGVIDSVLNLALEVDFFPNEVEVGDNTTITILVRNFGLASGRNVTIKSFNWPDNFLPESNVYELPSICKLETSILTCDVWKDATLPVATRGPPPFNLLIPSSYRIQFYAQVEVSAEFLRSFTELLILDTLFEASDVFIPNLPESTLNTVNGTLLIVPPEVQQVGQTTSSNDTNSLIIAIVVSILGILIIIAILKKKGFFQRKKAPPSLDGGDFNDGDENHYGSALPQSTEEKI